MKEEKIYTLSSDEVLKLMKSGTDGLTTGEVESRQKKFGMNELPDFRRVPRWQILVSQFKSPIVLLLLVAAIVSYFFGDVTDMIAILFVILVNGLIGYILESQAMRSMRALRRLDKIFCRVRRDGQLLEIDAAELVPGDLVMLEAGDLVPADGRIISSQRCQVNEASLTGESVPVEKDEESILPENTVLADRRNMVYKGTSVTKGNATMLVSATGISTEIGEISKMVESAQKDEIPLNEKLNQFGKRLIWLTLVLIVLFFIIGLLRGRELYEILETAIALAVAAIPEGLPIVATISLARGMLVLAKKNVIIKKLAAVETLGETDIIITDKTGTLTENKLEVSAVEARSDPESLMLAAILCNNASRVQDGGFKGDPVEIALLEYYEKLNPEQFLKIQQEWEEIEELPFDSDFKYMANLYRKGENYITVAKGSPAVILGLSSNRADGTMITDEVRKEWLEKTDTLASEGLKVLGFAFRTWETKPGRFNEDLEFSGLIGFIDPARSDVPKAIQDCHNAGIRVIMATGDHPSTALAIAKQTGLTKGDESAIIQGADLDSLHGDEWTSRVSAADILSRVTPRQKLQVVTHYQEKGHIVGMTGDGVNDAPALKKSDIGIAMGMRGTQVAEEAADMVIQDDAFTSIVQAIRQGRIIFGNIKNFVIYLLSCNLSEIMVVSIATLFSTVLPLLPLQILFLNIVTDVFPALALGMGKGNEQVMHHNSRNPKDPILNKRNWRTIFLYAAALTASILAAYFYAIKLLDYDPLRVNTITFFALAFAQLTHPFSLPNGKEPFFANPVFTNRFLWGAIFLCTFLLLISIYIPILREILGLGIPSPADWLIILLASIAPVLIIRSIKIVLRHE